MPRSRIQEPTESYGVLLAIDPRPQLVGEVLVPRPHGVSQFETRETRVDCFA